MGTKKEALERKAAWAAALTEGRVVRFNGGAHLTSYPTVERAQAAVKKAVESGAEAEIVILPPLTPNAIIRRAHEEGLAIHHIDGDPRNNTIENLRIVAPKENSQK